MIFERGLQIHKVCCLFYSLSFLLSFKSLGSEKREYTGELLTKGSDSWTFVRTENHKGGKKKIQVEAKNKLKKRIYTERFIILDQVLQRYQWKRSKKQSVEVILKKEVQSGKLRYSYKKSGYKKKEFAIDRGTLFFEALPYLSPSFVKKDSSVKLVYFIHEQNQFAFDFEKYRKNDAQEVILMSNHSLLLRYFFPQERFTFSLQGEELLHQDHFNSWFDSEFASIHVPRLVIKWKKSP